MVMPPRWATSHLDGPVFQSLWVWGSEKSNLQDLRARKCWSSCSPRVQQVWAAQVRLEQLRPGLWPAYHVGITAPCPYIVAPAPS